MAAGLIALILAALFTGAALYISLVEHPARQGLDASAERAHWAQSYKRALPIQAALAMIGGAAGLIAFALLHDWRWIAGGAALIANWPYTLTMIMPVNRRLEAIAPDAAGAESRALLVRWGRLHAGRGALGILALLFFAWGLLH